MTSHDYDYLMHFGNIGIPEEPTYENIGRVLDCLVPVAQPKLVFKNQKEVERLRGTPGEPVPIYVMVCTVDMRFFDDLGPLELDTSVLCEVVADPVGRERLSRSFKYMYKSSYVKPLQLIYAHT